MAEQTIFKGIDISASTFFKGDTGEKFFKNTDILDGTPNGGGNPDPDIVAPVITLIGGSVENVIEGTSYTDPGATATDNIDGDISFNIVVGGDTVDINTVGTYVITYNVSDAAGNAAVQVTRTVNINASTGSWLDRNIPTPSYIYETPTGTAPSISTTYTPTSSADLSNPANANKIAIISNSFSAAGVTLASGQIIRPAGGQISGTNINLNDAYIETVPQRAFSTSATFSTLYDRSRVYIELFGANSSDSVDDIPAITSAIENCAFLTSQTGQVYLANQDRHAGIFNPISRSGILDWDMNGAILRTTNNSTFRQSPGELTHQGYYILPLADFDVVSIYNGEFDGQDLASRFLDIYNCNEFNFDDLNIHNLESPAFAIARAVAINFSLFPNNTGFTQGFVTNCTINQVNAIGDGVSNNSDGIAKALNFSIRDNGVADVFVNNNNFTNIVGDDAEGFYIRGDGAHTNASQELYVHIKNNNFINCQRRGIKYDASNCFIENNLIESSATVVGNQAAMLQMFSIEAGVPVKNGFIQNNNIRILGDSENSFFGTNDSRDIIVRNNTFFADKLTVHRSLSFSNVTGQQDALYDGDLSNCEFTGNTITNAFIAILDKYYVLPGLNEIIFENNVQNFTGSVSLGAFRGAINVNASSLGGQMRGEDEFRIRNHTINYDLNTMSTGTWNGVISSNGTEPKNLVLENVNINYTGSGFVGAVFGGVRSGSVVDYDSTNQIINCNITGYSGTNSLEFNGSDKSVIITNSFGDGNTPITFQ